MGNLSAQSGEFFNEITVRQAVSQIEPSIQLRSLLILFRRTLIAESAEEKNAEDSESSPRSLRVLCVLRDFFFRSLRLFLRAVFDRQRMSERVFV